jgi:hypothetical protein
MAIRVEFPGLCLFVVDGRSRPVTVLLPNARNESGELHPDGFEKGAPHYAWYLETRNGVVQRKLELKGQQITLRAGSARPKLDTFDGIVNIGGFTSGLRLRPESELARPDVAAARVTVGGGSLSAAFLSPRGDWSFDESLKPGHGYSGERFAYRTVWTPRKTKLDVVMDGETYTLDASGRADVRVIIGNADEPDPETWDEIRPKPCVGNRVVDTDFKWYYRLFQPPGSWEELLQGRPLPAPTLDCATLDRTDPLLQTRAAGAPTCFGGSWCPPTGEC